MVKSKGREKVIVLSKQFPPKYVGIRGKFENSHRFGLYFNKIRESAFLQISHRFLNVFKGLQRKRKEKGGNWGKGGKMAKK